jgi:alkylated DNA repair dioxygenase AlkB
MYQPQLSLEAEDGAPRVVLAKHGLVTYEPAFLGAAEASSLLRELLQEVRWRQDHLRIHGREIPFPRLTAWYGDPGAVYTYSGIANRPLAWTPGLARLRDRLRASVGAAFNSALLNLYRTGSDSMGWHADDEPELGPRPVVASGSLGAARRFELRSRLICYDHWHGWFQSCDTYARSVTTCKWNIIVIPNGYMIVGELEYKRRSNR